MDEHNNPRITSESRDRTLAPARIIFVIIALSLAFGLWYVTDGLIRRSHASLLPAMPDLGNDRVPVVQQITTADRNARGNPLSAAYIGALAKSYQASAYSKHVVPFIQDLSDGFFRPHLRTVGTMIRKNGHSFHELSSFPSGSMGS